MDKMRDLFVSEMDRLRDAIARTDSESLRRDYEKALKRMRRDLRDYDRFHAQTTTSCAGGKI